MQLAEQGQVDLDMPVTKYLPYFRIADDRYRAVTIRQMLTHTSGMPDEVDYEWDKPQYDDGALERYVRSLSGRNLKLEFQPGSKFQYSNMAYEVLGDLIAKVSGTSFEDYVRLHILEPLGVTRSTLLPKDADPKLMTWGQVLDEQGDPLRSRVFPYNRMHSPSSDLLSNAMDMARWVMVNLNHRQAGWNANPEGSHVRRNVEAGA